MKIAIISTGDELLRGAIADTNGAWIASQLYEIGLDVRRITVVPDNLNDLTCALKEAFNDNDIIIVGGGLGPTDDDLTAEAAAAAAGLILERNEVAVSQVTARFETMGRDMHEINLKQAMLPQGCKLLENEFGTAPGFSFEVSSAQAFFLPGVPREIKPMFEKHVLPRLALSRKERHRSVFKCFGMGESNIQAALKPVQASHGGLKLAFRASFPEILVSASADDAVSLRRAVEDIRPILKGVAFAEEETTLPAVLGKEILSRGLTLATAESCSGGLIAHEITQIPGSSEYFKGGIVAYDNQVKKDALKVDETLIVTHGAVSKEVVSAMARGALHVLGADLSMATSGVAGPSGGTKEKPVGLVHIAVAYGQKLSHRSCMFQGYKRAAVKTAATWTAMSMLLKILTETE